MFDWTAASRMYRRWMVLVFGESLAAAVAPRVRVMRLLEEVVELSQAELVTEDEAVAIVRQVYAKPSGLAYQERGGVMLTLVGYADSVQADLSHDFWEEMARVFDPEIVERVRYRNLHGDKIGMAKS